MEINLNFVLLKDLTEKPDGSGAEAHIVILRESKDVDSAPNSASADFDSLK